MDLETVVLHELGRALGFSEDDTRRLEIMEVTLAPGATRRVTWLSPVPPPSQPGRETAAVAQTEVRSSAIAIQVGMPSLLARVTSVTQPRSRSLRPTLSPRSRPSLVVHRMRMIGRISTRIARP
jgi:hypothetical protein